MKQLQQNHGDQIDRDLHVVYLQNYIRSMRAVHDAPTQSNDNCGPNEEQYDSEEWDSDDDDCT